MKIRKRYWAICFLLLALTSMLFLSSGMPHLVIGAQWQGPNRNISDGEYGGGTAAELLFDRLPTIPDTVLFILVISTIVIVPVTFFLALFSPEARRTLIGSLKRVLSLAVWMIAILIFLRRLRLEQNPSRSPGVADARVIQPPEWIARPSALTAFLIGLVSLGLLGGLGWILWRRRRRNQTGLLTSEAQVTIDRLHAGHNFRSVIIDCYYRMCRILSEQRGLQRATSMTAREFASRLQLAGVGGVEAQRLTSLFEVVRYGAQSLSEAEKREAIECLAAVAGADQ